MRITIIVIIFFFCSCILHSESLPFSFIDNLNQLKSKERVDLLVTEIPDILSLVKFSDSLDIIWIQHPEFYGNEYKFELNIEEVGTWLGLHMIELKKENEQLKQEINKLK